jgi:misacylated tRNA(Ala) deacylase
MTELIHFTDCYAAEFDAVVVDLLDSAVVLDKTAFYPEGGGQPNDTGKLSWSGGEVPVVKVRKEGGQVNHFVPGTLPTVGAKVHGSIDWDKRYAYMRYHTAQHLLSAHFLEEHGASTNGNQIWSNRARIDFDLPSLTPEIVGSAEHRVRYLVEDALPVNISMVPRDEAIQRLDPKRTRIDRLPPSVKVLRIVEIEGIDIVACAGTHVKNTSELGLFTISKTTSKGTGRKRVEFTLT